MSAGRLCAPRTITRCCLRSPTPRVVDRTNGRPSWALGGPRRPFPCVLLPSCFRSAGCECASQDLRTRRTVAQGAGDGAGASASVGGVRGVCCEPAGSRGPLARWPRARHDACALTASHSWREIDVLRSPGRPRGGSGRVRGGRAVLHGHAGGRRSAGGERLGPYSALARLSCTRSVMRIVGDIVEIVSPMYVMPVLQTRGSVLVDASGQSSASLRARRAHPGHLRLWADHSTEGYIRK